MEPDLLAAAVVPPDFERRFGGLARLYGTAGAQQIPTWVETAGNLVSIAFLFAIGILNLMTLARTPANHPAVPRGLRSGLFARATRVSHPLLIFLIGAAFAISMDTMSQAAVFSLAASGEFSWSVALLLGLIFTLGMLLVDAANGLWVYRLINGAGADAIWSRRLTLTIGLLSLGIAVFGLVRLVHLNLDGWYSAYALQIGIASTVLLMAVYLAGRLRRPTPGR